MFFDSSTLHTAGFIARQLAHGAWVTVQITAMAEGVVLVMSFVIALMRLSPSRPLRWIATGYVTFSAYGSEIVRAALVNVSRGQGDAVRALDIDPATAFRRITLPQALPFMLPPLGNQLVELMKTTSLVSLITLSDLTFSGAQLITTLGQQTLIWSIVLVCYFLMAWPLNWLVRRYERHITAWRPGSAG
jgi:polar amino acid transport system permease protein